MQEILGLVRRCVTDYDMIQEGETVAVGVSGGKDSLVTLTALARLSKFYQKPFKVVAITVETGVPGMSFDAVADYCAALGVEYIRVNVPIYEIVFLERKEKNPCSLCAKLRRGALSTAMNEHGIKTIALGHHYDDAVETLLMNLLFEGRIGCFQPVTYLSRSDVTQIRPLLYVKEQQVRNVAAKLDLPIVHNPCPANGETRRQEVKELIESLSERYPDLKQKLFGAMQRYPLYGWDTKNNPIRKSDVVTFPRIFHCALCLGLASERGQFDTRFAQSVFCHACRGRKRLKFFVPAGTKALRGFVLCTLNKYQPQQDQQCEARHAEDGDDESVERFSPSESLASTPSALRMPSSAKPSSVLTSSLPASFNGAANSLSTASSANTANRTSSIFSVIPILRPPRCTFCTRLRRCAP